MREDVEITTLSHPLVGKLRRSLTQRPGRRAQVAEAVRRAAVALVLAPGAEGGGELELLFIKRAEFAGDPWSGQVAFPGGRREPRDASLIHTAVRETHEETGVQLVPPVELLGELDELYPRTPVLPPIVVRPFVFAAPSAAPLSLSDEVSSAFWAPLLELDGPEASFETTVQVHGESRCVQCIRHGDYMIWGMTERILRQLLARAA